MLVASDTSPPRRNVGARDDLTLQQSHDLDRKINHSIKHGDSDNKFAILRRDKRDATIGAAIDYWNDSLPAAPSSIASSCRNVGRGRPILEEEEQEWVRPQWSRTEHNHGKPSTANTRRDTTALGWTSSSLVVSELSSLLSPHPDRGWSVGPLLINKYSFEIQYDSDWL